MKSTMSKQSTIAGFFNKEQSGSTNGTITAPAQKTSRFKYVKPPSRTRPETVSNENLSLNAVARQPNLLTIQKDNKSFSHNVADKLKIDETNTSNLKKIPSCIDITDEDEFIPNSADNSLSSPPRSATLVTRKDDSFLASCENDFFVTKTPKKTESKLTIEDIYAKYGSPETKTNGITSTKTTDILDIEKSLKANPSYIQATEKLNENLEKCDSIQSNPLTKPSVKNPFKFSARKPISSTITTVSTSAKPRTETVTRKSNETETKSDWDCSSSINRPSLSSSLGTTSINQSNKLDSTAPSAQLDS